MQSTKKLEDKPRKKVRSEAYLKYQKYLKSKQWKEIRDKVLERDEFRCRCCARDIIHDDAVLTVHHSCYKTPDGNDILYHELEGDNLKYLITLCRQCHNFGIHKVSANFKRFSMK